ncbi:hypothetical protein [Streptomyces sp. NBC_00453]|uniref:hypothetical protein n=1 Tax=Streptomyces sp. NBC_00453 TaxID=2903653 RepID=UPI002E20E714
MMFWYDHHMSGWGWFGASLGMIVFWGLIIAAFVLLLRAFDRPQPKARGFRESWTCLVRNPPVDGHILPRQRRVRARQLSDP